MYAAKLLKKIDEKVKEGFFSLSQTEYKMSALILLYSLFFYFFLPIYLSKSS